MTVKKNGIFLKVILKNLSADWSIDYFMSWETIVDEIWKCPKCGYEIRKVFRMDDWNRREYTEYESGKIIKESCARDFSQPLCKSCRSLMELMREAN